MVHDYRSYEPMLLDEASMDTLTSDDYRRFILNATIVPGLRLVLARHDKRPDWPYVDTKFDPRTGRDLPAARYQVVHSWFLGRGSQSLATHLAWLDRLEDLPADERRRAREVLGHLVEAMTDAIVTIAHRNLGRVPFRLNRDFEAIDEHGQRIEADANQAGAGDIFCAKGLVAEGSDAKMRMGVEMLGRAASLIRQNRYAVEQFAEQPADIGQGPKMLFQDTAALIAARTTEPSLRRPVFDAAAEFMATVLDKHYDPDTGVFAEYIDPQTDARKPYLDPGHAAEFVGLGLGAIEAMRGDAALLDGSRKALLDRACRQMPRLLVKDIELGFNPKHPGLFKAVDTQSGEVLNDDMPWWNLPETMRAAIRAVEVADDDPTRQQCLEIVRICHNAYFANYPNRDNMLFPYQTISGRTGQVIDKVPAVPEGDPLYHTNLALLDMLDVLERL